MTIDELWMSLAQRRRLRRVSLCYFNQIKEFLNSTFVNRHSTFFMLEFLLRLDWTPVASGSAHIKLRLA
jgi:hypothetical protein